jgi:hypothetical protein
MVIIFVLTVIQIHSVPRREVKNKKWKIMIMDNEKAENEQQKEKKN